jgi:epoxyqueuosine reductase
MNSGLFSFIDKISIFYVAYSLLSPVLTFSFPPDSDLNSILNMNRSDEIKSIAIQMGFDAAGITTAESIDIVHREYYNSWLSQGRAANMSYLYRNIEKRFDPSKLLSDAKSVICVAINYKQAINTPNPSYKIASFALYEDYHLLLKDKLFKLAEAIQLEYPDKIGFKACVDSVPLAERALAQRAGLGFIGRNCMLIHPELGNHLLLGELITTLDLEPDQPMESSGCQNCCRCVEACPTGALEPDGTLDARKCISYLTIEEQGNLPSEYTDKLDNYIFGCDECLKACPHSTAGPLSTNPALKAHPEWLTLTRQQILNMSQSEFEVFFANSGLLRLGLDRLKRNCLTPKRHKLPPN